MSWTPTSADVWEPPTRFPRSSVKFANAVVWRTEPSGVSVGTVAVKRIECAPAPTWVRFQVNRPPAAEEYTGLAEDSGTPVGRNTSTMTEAARARRVLL